jgi:hypothetical protein
MRQNGKADLPCLPRHERRSSTVTIKLTHRSAGTEHDARPRSFAQWFAMVVGRTRNGGKGWATCPPFEKFSGHSVAPWWYPAQ